jgi:hypothetical protein
MTKNRILLLGALLCVALLQGCATNVKASAKQNPAPTEAFSAFGQIELKPVVFRAGLAGDEKGLSKINENLTDDLAPSIAKWNIRKLNSRSLTIEPVIEAFEFKHGPKRVLLGPLAGSSGVLIKVKITDGAGNVIAHPEFFQRATAASGMLMGVADNIMLVRIANLINDYVVANFERAQGGPTGADDQALASN